MSVGASAEEESVMRTSTCMFGALLAAVVLGGCGGSNGDSQAGEGTSGAPVSPSNSVTASDSGHTAEAGEPELIQVDGYKYTDPTGAEVNACKLFSDEIVEGCSVHGVSGLGMALLVEWQFNPDVVPPGTLVSSLNTTFAQQNATVKNLTITGEPVIRGTMPDGKTTLFAWEHEGVVAMFQSDEPQDAEDFVTQYVTQLND
jgi:hypothetical protein